MLWSVTRLLRPRDLFALILGRQLYAVQVPTGMTPGFCHALNCPVALGFVYPPFAALVLAPISLLSLSALRLVWFSAIFLCLEGTVWISLGWAGVRNRLLRLAVAIGAAADPGRCLQVNADQVRLLTLRGTPPLPAMPLPGALVLAPGSRGLT